MWNWQHPDWPNFEYDPSLFKERVEAFYRSAERLSGRIEGMAERYQSDTVIDLMLSEAITTSAIEGETLDRDSVRSSLLHLIGKEVASPNSDEKAAGAAALMVDVRKNGISRSPMNYLVAGRQWPVQRTEPAWRCGVCIGVMPCKSSAVR